MVIFPSWGSQSRVLTAQLKVKRLRVCIDKMVGESSESEELADEARPLIKAAGTFTGQEVQGGR